jgi:hypothetical protein
VFALTLPLEEFWSVLGKDILELSMLNIAFQKIRLLGIEIDRWNYLG